MDLLSGTQSVLLDAYGSFPAWLLYMYICNDLWCVVWQESGRGILSSMDFSVIIFFVQSSGADTRKIPAQPTVYFYFYEHWDSFRSKQCCVHLSLLCCWWKRSHQNVPISAQSVIKSYTLQLKNSICSWLEIQRLWISTIFWQEWYS